MKWAAAIISLGLLLVGLYCDDVFDGVSCWSRTPAGTLAVIRCFSEFNKVKYDDSELASKFCFMNATWANSNYTRCRPIHDKHEILSNEWDVTDQTLIIYYVGYSISLLALIVALTIFIYFKDLRCLRNTFHANLMLTYVLVNVTWIATASTHLSTTSTCIMVIFLYYFKGTNFFWMFVEGFYLYLLVVKTFSVENFRFQFYLLIGWGSPAVVVTVWAAVKSQLVGNSSLEPNELKQNKLCPWLEQHAYDWIFICPILLVLFVNMVFLSIIMWVLITKLRAATSTESQQYKKAAKALLVLIPLLGITYILIIAAPSEGLAGAIFAYLRAILLSTQGFTVSVLYCFLNAEVRTTLRHHWERWREERTVGFRSQHSLRCFRDGSPKTGTESIRLCNSDSRSGIGHGRDSSVSCVTSSSFVGNGYSTAATPNNGTAVNATDSVPTVKEISV